MSEVINSVLLIKIGTDVLSIRHDDGTEELDDGSFESNGSQIKGRGEAVGVVTSAGITAALGETGGVRPDKKTDMQKLQALASVGVPLLLEHWRRKAFDGRIIGGLLLTRSELDIKKPERDQALRTIHTMMSNGWIPVINENDAIAHEEIAFGDNDILAAELAAQMARSALFGTVRLVLLSSVDGVYERKDDPSSVISLIPYGKIADYEHLIYDRNSEISNGGMASKFEAAKIVTPRGVEMWIANGRTEDAIQRTLDGQIGTHFMAKAG